jgi:hypothetical protein
VFLKEAARYRVVERSARSHFHGHLAPVCFRVTPPSRQPPFADRALSRRQSAITLSGAS